MANDIPDLDEVHQRLLDDHQARLPDDNVSWFSDNWKRLRTIAAAIWGLYHAGNITYKDLFYDTASSTGLIRWGEMLNVPRRGATGASKDDALRVVGTVTATVSLGDALTHPGSGLAYALTENGVIPAAGYVDVGVRATDTGVQTKLDAGQTLEFDAPPAGIEKEAELQLALDENGLDEEVPAEWQVRIGDTLAQPGLGGAANDYRVWSLEIDGIRVVYVYPSRAGRGSVDVAALHAGQGSVRLLDAAERVVLQAKLDAERPVTVKACRVLEVTTKEIDIDMEVEPRPGANYAADWTGTLIVAVWTAATRLLEFTVDRPGDMLAGDMLCIATGAGNGTGQQYLIEELDAVSDKKVILAVEPSPAPQAADTVYSGGDLTDRARDKLLAHVNGLGPAVGVYGTGEWDSAVNPRRLEAEVYTVDGVRNCETLTPVATETADDPIYPNDDTIELLVPGQVIVRYA